MKTSDANETYAPKSLVETVSNQSTTISTLATKNELSTGLAGKLDNSAASSFVPTTRTINGTALTDDIWITATDPNAATKDELNGLATTVANKADVSALANFATTDALSSGLSGKQETLVSGTNIKTIEGKSILGSGDIQITAAEVGAYTTGQVDEKVTALNNAISGKADPSTVNAVSDRVSALEGYFSTAEDSDATINKWGEIVNFLDGVAEGSNVEQLLAAKANQSALDNLSTTVSNVDAKFANYLPLSGGTMTGNIVINYSEFGENTAYGGFVRFGSNYLHITNDAAYYNWNTLLHSGNYSDYALPLSGGQITGRLELYDRLHMGSQVIEMGKGLFGAFEGNESLYWYTPTSNIWNTLIHSGNIGSHALTLDGGYLNNNRGIAWYNNVCSWDEVGDGLIGVSNVTDSLGYYAGLSFKAYYGLQIRAYGGDTDFLEIRGYNAANWGNWRKIIHSGNIGSQSVAYATSAGNADTLDGVHINNVVHLQDVTDADTMINGVTSYSNVDVNAYHVPFQGGELLSFGHEWYSAQLYVSHYSHRAAVRGLNYGTWMNWHELAFTDSDITGNAATATYASNAGTLGGYAPSYGSNTPWGTIPIITHGGWMEVGKSFEFHYDNTTETDFSTALMCTGNYGNTVNLPSASGTLALTTDNVASADYATTAGSAGTANSVAWDNVSGRPSSLPANGGNADTVDGQHFSYSNEADAPTWVWATNENGTSFLAKRANLSVNYANSASSATYDSNWNHIANTYATKSEIPSVGNGTVTITQNGTSKGSFTLNQSGNATIELTDTNTHPDLSGYATQSWVSSNFNYSTDSWRPITDSYSGSDQGTSLSQYGANALYNALVNGYAAEAGYASSAGSANSVA